MCVSGFDCALLLCKVQRCGVVVKPRASARYPIVVLLDWCFGTLLPATEAQRGSGGIAVLFL